MKLRASGHISTPRLELGTVIATNVNGIVELSGGKLRINELRADLLGGHQNGSWIADFTVSPPRFMGNGIVSKLSMTQLAGLMHDNWATGNVDAEYSLTLAGLNPASLRDSASGSADFTWSGGSLRHVILEGRGAPMTFSNFAGKVALQNGTFNLTGLQAAVERNSVCGEGHCILRPQSRSATAALRRTVVRHLRNTRPAHACRP